MRETCCSKCVMYGKKTSAAYEPNVLTVPKLIADATDVMDAAVYFLSCMYATNWVRMCPETGKLKWSLCTV